MSYARNLNIVSVKQDVKAEEEASFGPTGDVAPTFVVLPQCIKYTILPQKSYTTPS